MFGVSMPRQSALATLLLFALPVLAADTVEPFDEGAGNVEVYSVVDGVGRSEVDQAFAGDMLVGWGLTRRFSAYLGTSMQADGYLSSAETELGMGVFGTLYDSDHLDLDLLLDFRTGGDGMSEALLAPAFELNLDRAPDLAAYGLYLRGAAEVAGRQHEDTVRRHVDLGLTVGSYWTLRPGQQLLIEYDATVHDAPDPGTPGYENGGLSLGYNAQIGGTLELINEVRWDIPQSGESGNLGFMVGVIATLPGMID